MSWLAALGEAALDTSRRIRSNRLEEEELALRKANEKRLIEAALLQKQAAEREKTLFERNMARDVLESAGPGGMVDTAGAETVRRGGLGFRLRDQEALLPATTFVPSVDPSANPLGDRAELAGQEAGTVVVPNAAQQAQLDEQAFVKGERTKQAKLRDFIQSDKFFQLPQASRQRYMALAGLPGPAPETPEEMQKLQDYLFNQQKQLMQMQIDAGRFSGGERNSEEQLYYQNVDRITDKVHAEYMTVLRAAAQRGDWAKVEQIQKQMRADIDARVNALPKPASLKLNEPPARIDDEVDRFLAGLSPRRLQVIVANIGSPKFRKELEAEHGVDASRIFARLQSSGFLDKPAPAAAAPTPSAPPRPLRVPPPATRSPLMDTPTLRTPGGKVAVSPLQYELFELENDRERLRRLGLVP